MKQTIYDPNSTRPIDVICMGRVAVDLYSEQVGADLADAQTFRKYLGGCAGNIAVGVARLGLKSSMLSCIGTDAMGKFLEKNLQFEGVDTTHLRHSKEHLTALVLLGVNPPDRFPLIFYRQNCADMQLAPQDLDEGYFAKAKALVITGTGLSHPLSQKTTLHAISLAKANNTKVILDCDYRPVLWGLTQAGDGETRYIANQKISDTFLSVLPQLDLIVGTEEEIKIAGGSEITSIALENIRNVSTAPIVMKTGEKGCKIYLDNLKEPLNIPSYPVKIINVLGAGDAFISALIVSLLKGYDWQESGLMANAAGALVVTRHGCAPAMPSMDELKYFRNNFEASASVLTHKKLTLIHKETELKNFARQQNMFVMAFCHRWQFEQDCQKNNKPYSLINQFKSLVYKGFYQAHSSLKLTNSWILTDPFYGSEAIRHAQSHGIPVIAPIEASGKEFTQWLHPTSAYDILIERPKDWGVKILWNYHPKLERTQKNHQIAKLIELDTACQRLERKLMLELIPNSSFEDNASEDILSECIQDVYKAGIYPYWWKLPPIANASNWQSITTTINEIDPHARVILLGGGNGFSVDQFRNFFQIAKTTPHGIGFAIGRTIFWQHWIDFRMGLKNKDQIVLGIANSFQSFCQSWLSC